MRAAAILLLGLLLGACSEPEPVARPRRRRPEVRRDGPDHVVMDHVLIGFRGARRSGSTRTKEQARELAYGILRQVKAGVKFQFLKQEHSDDRAPDGGRANGPYEIANFGVRSTMPEIPRANYAKTVGDIAFHLKPGELAVADYHPRDCPFGYHVIARLK